MSVLTDRRKKLSDVPLDEMYVIYGEPGSGKTVLASTFPKSTAHKMLFLDVGEGGTGSIPSAFEDMIDVVRIETFEEFDEVITDLYNGKTKDSTGKEYSINYKTIVIDTITQVEYILKGMLKSNASKSTMTLRLWGEAKDNQEGMYNLMKSLHQKTSSIMVSIAHVKKIEDVDHPGFNVEVPSLMNSATRILCAKASFVWFTKAESVQVVDATTNDITHKTVFNTYVDTHPYLLTKCRKEPKYSKKIPSVITNCTYDKFANEVLEVIKGGTA